MAADDLTERPDDLGPSAGFFDEMRRAIESAAPAPTPESPEDEREAVRRRWLTPEPAEPEAAVGISPLARELEDEGWFSRLEAQHAAHRQQERQRAIEESQGWSAQRIAEGLFDLVRGQPLTREEALAAGQAELETRQRTAPQRRELANIYRESAGGYQLPRQQALQGDMGPGRVPVTGMPPPLPQVAHDIVGHLIAADAAKQEEALARAQRMMRGEESLPTQGYWRAAILTGARTIADMISSMPIQTAGILTGYATGVYDVATTGEPFQWRDNRLYKFGQQVEAYVKQAFPGDPARQYEFAQTLAQGLGSTIAFGGQGVVASLLGAGPRGQLALITLSGAAAQVPSEFARVTAALRRGDATERDRAIVVLSNLALGATESVPFSGTLNAAASAWRARLGAGLGQLIEEAIQETGQQVGGNVTRMLTYDPKQDLYEGVLEAAVVAAMAGFGAGTTLSGGGRGAPAVVPPLPLPPQSAHEAANCGGAWASGRSVGRSGR